MYSFRDYYKNELGNQRTNYFIFDTAGPGPHGDVDFDKYYWDADKFNQVKCGDLFIYRRPQKASNVKGQFYFFGAGKIEVIKRISEIHLEATIVKPYDFKEKLLQSDLNDFNWQFKQKQNVNQWGHFFNQYGMNKITKNDFINLMTLQETDEVGSATENDITEEVAIFQQLQRGDFRIEDQRGSTKIRGNAQRVFANQVKGNYGYECAITGIRTKEFLVASHIIPWSVDENNRINPQNGICLSVFLDKAFDQGYITFSEENKVIISDIAESDQELYRLLAPYAGKRLHVRKEFSPNPKFLEWHRNNRLLQYNEQYKKKAAVVN